METAEHPPDPATPCEDAGSTAEVPSAPSVQRAGRKERAVALATAFLEGAAVLVVEIAGARALAPYFGASLRVWTSQITATLLFLAVGYGAGGKLSTIPGSWRLPAVFGAAGAWLVVFPFLRAGVLETSAEAGVAGGALLAASLLFGPPLSALGAVSPLLVQRLRAFGLEAGESAGAIFFTNTMGGLAGGWLTALVLIPYVPVRISLSAVGVLLLLVALLWALRLQTRIRAAALALLGGAALSMVPMRPPSSLLLGALTPASVRWRQQSSVGLLEVLDVNPGRRFLLIDGITQGGMSLETGTSSCEFTEYLNYMGFRYHPQAKTALLLGLGAGMLAKELLERGVSVTVVEIEPRVDAVARDWFALPSAVRVEYADARAWLNRSRDRFDLVFLDAFAGECVPWHLVTRQGLRRIEAALNDRGRVVINTVTQPDGQSTGLKELESSLKRAFGEARVFVDERTSPGQRLVNATLVAGTGLNSHVNLLPFPGRLVDGFATRIAALESHGRDARDDGTESDDDLSDLDSADADLRSIWRQEVLDSLPVEAIVD